jgi:hypothetical protein
VLAKFEAELDWVVDLEEDLTGFVFEVLGFVVCLAVFLAVFFDVDLFVLVAAEAEVRSKKKRGKKSKINKKVYIILQLIFIGSF